MAGRFSVEAVFRATDRITAPISKMQNRVGKMTRTMSNGFRRLNKTVGKFASGIKKGAAVTAAALLVVGTAMSGAAMAGVNFEQAITDVGAVALLTRSEIEPLEKLALELGRTTKFTATQAANAMEVLSRAGFKSQEILQATPAILSAAAASGLEIAEVANHVSNALKGMGLDTSRAAQVADVLALASSKTNSSIGSLGESLSNVASTARSLKIPFKEVVAGVALLQDVGLDASVAGSALNTMLTKMAAPTADITKKMKKFGITFKDAKGDMLPFQKVLQQLSIASKKAGGNFDKVAFLAELVGLRGQKAASNLADLFAEGKFKKLVDQLGDAEGAAKKMADLRMDTVKGSFLLLGSAIDAVKVKTFGMNRGPLKETIDKLTEWVGKNEEIIAQDISKGIEEAIPSLRIAADLFAAIARGVIATGKGLGIVAAKMVIAFEEIVNSPGFKAFMGGIQSINTFLEQGFGQISRAPEAVSGFLERGIGQISSGFGLFGGRKEETPVAGAGNDGSPQVVSPQERVARSIEEQRSTSTAEVTLRADQGTQAEVTKGKMGPGLKLQSSGAF